jgi:hypothetical protein
MALGMSATSSDDAPAFEHVPEVEAASPATPPAEAPHADNSGDESATRVGNTGGGSGNRHFDGTVMGSDYDEELHKRRKRKERMLHLVTDIDSRWQVAVTTIVLTAAHFPMSWMLSCNKLRLPEPFQ